MARKKPKTNFGDVESLKKQFKDFLVDPSRLRVSENDIISTGSINVDYLLGGGLHRGSLSEFYGPPGGGKSTLAIRTAGEVLAAGGNVAYLDLEHGLGAGIRFEDGEDIIEQDGWLQKNGVDPQNERFDVWTPTFAEDIFAFLLAVAQNDLYDLVILDSFARLVTRSEMEDEIGASNYGKVAKIASEGLKKLFIAYEQGNAKSHICIINQIRDNIGGHGYKSTGGNALPHYCATRLNIFRIGGDDTLHESTTRAKIINKKNRFSPPGSTEITISSIFGLDRDQELLEWCLTNGRITQAGAWYTIYTSPDQKEQLGKLQGSFAVKEYLRENNWYEYLKPEMRASMFRGTDASTK